MDGELRESIDSLRESIDALRDAIDGRTNLGEGNGAGDVHQRLQVLARLEQDGLISEDEYSERKDELLREWSR